MVDPVIQADYQIARKYWNKLKQRFGKEGNQLVINCHRLKLTASVGNKGALGSPISQPLSISK